MKDFSEIFLNALTKASDPLAGPETPVSCKSLG